MDNVKYFSEDSKFLLDTRSFVIDNIEQLSEEELQDKIREDATANGYNLDDSDIKVIYNTSQNVVEYDIFKDEKLMVPYEKEALEIFSGSFNVPETSISEDEERAIIGKKLEEAGIALDNSVDYEIQYFDTRMNDNNELEVPFSIYQISWKRVVDENNVKDEKVDSLETALNEYKTLKKTLEILDEELEDKTIFNALTDMVMEMEQNSTVNKMTGDFKSELEYIDKEIKYLTEEIEEEEKIYEEVFENLQKLVDSENLELEDMDFLTSEELIEFREGYVQKKLVETEKAQIIKKKIEDIRTEIATLATRKQEIENNILKAENLEITEEDYKEIASILQKKKLFDAIIAKKKEETVKEIAELQKNSNLSVLEAIEALYNIDTKAILEDSREVEVSQETINTIKNNSSDLPEKVKNNEAMNNYIPNQAPSDMIEAHKRKDSNDTIEKIVVYSDLDNKLENYVRKSTLKRFNLRPEKEIKIDGASFFAISVADLEKIKENADNDFSPYRVEEREKKLNLENNNMNVEAVDLANGNNQVAPDDISDNLNGNSTENADQVDEGENENQDENSNNSADENVADSASSNENSGDTVTKETIILYKDLNDNNQLYANEEVLRKFGIIPTGDGKTINGGNCYKISNDADRIINYIARTSENPKITVRYVNVKLKKEEKPHVEAILDKLTDNLDIGAKDCARFKASNIKVAESFKKELKSGNFLYNVFHFVPAVIKLPFMFAKKLVGKLMMSAKAKKNMKELQRRLDEDLTEDELEVLFDEYKGSQLKTDMNNQINGLIGERLTRYGLEKVAGLNNVIKDSYTSLFALLGQVKAIEEQLASENIDEEIAHELMVQRGVIIDNASSLVKKILISRKDANNLLSSGVHGIEEDFKAVSSKLSYVGMRFAKTNDFDNELQHKLGEFGKGLNEALSKGDNEEIVSNFMGLESCYFENTKIAKSVTGKRSIGAKYYSPIAEQFDYRDDPFIRDIFTTLAVTSATVSAVNAVRVHQIEANKFLTERNQEVNNINASNDSIMDYVHQSANDITDKRDVFKEGMNVQVHKDIVGSANTIERSQLDMTNWSFNEAYHLADEKSHAFYNSFSDEVTNQINDIAGKYGSGSINSFEALQLMSDVSNKAHATLTNVSNECLGILKTYAESHPQFDLSAVQESMSYIVEHPDALTNMNQGMIDVTNIAEGLSELEATHLATLSSLPSDMLSTLVCAASATGLALNVSKTMKDKYSKKKKYGNEITEMMKEYLGQGESIEDIEDDYDADIETVMHR